MNHGFIKIIGVIILGIIILTLLNIDLRGLIEKIRQHDNYIFVKECLESVWEYMKKPANYVWAFFYGEIWLRLFEGK